MKQFSTTKQATSSRWRRGWITSVCLLVAVQFSSAQIRDREGIWSLAQRQASQLIQETEAIHQLDPSLVSPRSLKEDGGLIAVPKGDWTSGFFPGMLWYLYEHTGNSQWKDRAARYTQRIVSEQYNGRTHDMGFKIYCSVGNGFRLSGDTMYRNILVQAASTLATRFNPTVGCIRSWDHHQDVWSFPVIIDNMLNLELLFAATKLTGDSSYYRMAVSHANTTMKNHFRKDFTTYHVVDYDPQTGKVLKKNTHQGYRDESTWARGEAWALYGYTMCYRETQDIRYLRQAEKIAAWLLSHLPADGIPYWDFNVPQHAGEPRDASAASVMASAFLELSSYSTHAASYQEVANKQLNSLISTCASKPGEHRGFLLLHSTGSKPSGTEVDQPLIYADYYFLEALLRQEQLVRYGKITQLAVTPEERLLAIPDARGNRIPDFSRVGYHLGTKRIPEVPVRVTLSPSANGQDQQRIQQAIEQVEALAPDKRGIRGAILLKRGTYRIPGSLRITKGGVVLRGEGDQEDGTKLIATGRGQRSLLTITGSGQRKEIPATRTNIVDSLVPMGRLSFRVASTKGLKVGMPVVVHREASPAWIHAIQMDQIEEKEGNKQWKAEEYGLDFERSITEIAGNQVTLDNPVMMEIDQSLGGGSVYAYAFEGRIAENGVEQIYFESEYEGEEDEDHGWIAVYFNQAENAWVRNITARYFGYAAVSVGPDAKQVTVMDSQCLDAKSIITGGRRYSFNNDGQLNLFFNLFSREGRHDYVTGAKVLGPNVFYNCRSVHAHADNGPHHRWAVGTLYDNLITDGELNVQDRGNWGTGHGWAGVNQVFWNCQVQQAVVQSPWISGKNYAVGLLGGRYEGRLSGRLPGEWIAYRQHLSIPSLFRMQIQQRGNEGVILQAH